MEIEIDAAKSYENGIDFVSRNHDFVIRARRDSNGRVTISKGEASTFYESELMRKKGSIKQILAILVFSIFIALTLQLNIQKGVKTLICIATVWIITLGYYFLRSQKATDFTLYRFHGAEHKVLNYLDRYHSAPADIYMIKNTSNISYRCGSTMVAVIYYLATLITLSLVFLPTIGFKVVGCVLSVLVVLLLWALGYCNSFQKFLVKEPTMEELEVAYAGMLAYVEEVKMHKGV